MQKTTNEQTKIKDKTYNYELPLFSYCEVHQTTTEHEDMTCQYENPYRFCESTARSNCRHIKRLSPRKLAVFWLCHAICAAHLSSCCKLLVGLHCITVHCSVRGGNVAVGDLLRVM
jgi:hypothetical protein